MQTRTIRPLRNVQLPCRQSALARAIQCLFSGRTWLAAAGVLVSTTALAQTARIPANALPSGPAGQGLALGSTSVFQPQVLAGTFDPYRVSGNTATITQTNPAGILRWGSFNIGSGATVNIVQPSATAVLLNKVDGGLDQTIIEGMLNGNGQVYIYNPNGIVFGKSSQVNVASLVATTLKIEDSRFLAGLLDPSRDPIFQADSTLGHVPGAITVEGEIGSGGVLNQAQITAAQGGKILLVAPSIDNNGKLTALDGQVALAAAGKVYLASPRDLTMRGLLIEVNNDNLSASNRAATNATNDALGKILVGRGNASMVGLAVNQMGTISATTSVALNGSIFLRARDGASKDDAVTPLRATQGGTLRLGVGSRTEILPTLDDQTTTAASSNFNPSEIDLSGKTIHLEQNAAVVAPGGNVSITARSNPQLADLSPASASGIYVDSGAVIDVSGTTSTRLAMESNVIKVDLRGTELADVPLLKNSPIRGQTVSIDIRKGTPVGNVQGWLDLVQSNIGQRTATGGNVTFTADGYVALAANSLVNVSGGYVTYLPGYAATSRLVSGGVAYDIANAAPTRIYDSVLAPEASRSNYDPGYVQGMSAGSVVFDAPAMVSRGALLGQVTIGSRQRDVAAADHPFGGKLVIGQPQNNGTYDFNSNVLIGGTTMAGIALPGYSATNSPLSRALTSNFDFDTTTAIANGFSRLQVYTGGNVMSGSAISLAAGGELTLESANRIELAKDISAPGGTVVVTAPTVVIDPGVTLDVAGRWTNDGAAGTARDANGFPTTPVVIKGGSVALNAQDDLNLGSGVVIDASGGAWLNAAGTLSAGSGGSINLVGSTNPLSGGITFGSNVVLSAYGINKGGKLKLTADDVVLGAASGTGSPLYLDSPFFQHGGFSSYDIGATDNLTVAAGAEISPRMDSWLKSRTTAATASGRMSDAFSVTTPDLAGPFGARGASSLSLSAKAEATPGGGRLDVQAGAHISVDPGGSVNLSAGRQLTVDGEVTAPGGAITLALTPQVSSATQYLPERSIWLGSDAVLDASGSSARTWVDSQGLTLGSLLDGGSINFGRVDQGVWSAAAGYVVVNSGALLDVSGTSLVATLKPGARGTVSRGTLASAGGSIDIRAREGLLFAGTLKAAGGNASAVGGTLALVLDREAVAGPSAFPSDARNLIVSNVLPNIALAGADHPIVDLNGSNLNGQGFVLAGTINGGGFDWVSLKSQNSITFDLRNGGLTLNPRSGLSVDAPDIAARSNSSRQAVTLDAAYVQLGNTDWRYQTASAATTGNATLTVNADTIDLVGTSVLTGFDRASLNASSDIRLAGQVNYDLRAPVAVSQPVTHAWGNFSVVGDMALTAAQIYPTTMSEFTLAALGAHSVLQFASSRSAADFVPDAPLSAAGMLTATAATILQDGVVRAPFGAIAFNATDLLSYGGNSLTSVAGGAVVPLGLVQNGRDWLYDFGNGHTVNLSNSSASNYVPLVEKAILSSAAQVETNSGAVMDVSGGGDLLAYEFTPGPGGSRDVLAGTTVFAVVPGYRSAVAPRDFQYGQSSGLKVGDSIYLSGIPGLEAGYYTLLPAHYALTSPTAFAISSVSGTQSMASSDNYQKLDGSWIVSGQRRNLGGGTASYSSGFLLTPYSLLQQESEFTRYSANSFLAGVAATAPNDAGRVAFDVTHSLLLNGSIMLNAAMGGVRGSADISAPEIVVVSDRSQALPAGSSSDAVKLAVGDLAAIGADSLMLGGIRSAQGDGDHVSVGATTVVVANDTLHPLSGKEIILAAKDTVQVQDSGVVEGRGTPSRSGHDLLIDGSGASADGALLRVSGGNAVRAIRNAPSGVRGTLDIGTRASVSAGGSMLLDATAATLISGGFHLDPGAALGIGATRISLGTSAPAAVSGLRFDDTAVANLSTLSQLALTSYTTLDVYGAVNLGAVSMNKLTLSANGIDAFGSAGDNTLRNINLTAKTVALNGGSSVSTVPVGAAHGTLNVTGDEIEVGSGTFAIRGIQTSTLTARRELRATGEAGVVSSGADMTIAAGRITALSGRSATFSAGHGASDQLTLTQVAAPLASTTSGQFGGSLAFTGNRIVSDALVRASAGQVSMHADNGVTINGGTISTAGESVAFGSTQAYAPAGNVVLDGGLGEVTVGSAAVIDVSAVGADAGSLTVKASGSGSGRAQLDGVLKGNATAGVDGVVPTQGRFALDVDQVGSAADFAALNQKLNSAGFTESRDIRARNGDIALASADDRITAHHVVLATDSGDISIGGTIDASGSKGGRIELYASQAAASGSSGNLTLMSTAKLDAHATTAADSAAGSTGDGGSVLVSSGSADGLAPAGVSGGSSLALDAGSQIDVSGLGAGQNGTVTLRASRVGSAGGTDVAIARLGSTIRGSRSTSIEAYKVYTAQTISEAADNVATGNLSATTSGKMYTEANSLMSHASGVLTRLGLTGSGIAVTPGIEVRSTGDLTVSVNEESGALADRGWNLNTWHFGGTPGTLSLRAARNLVIEGSISDGFIKAAGLSMPDWQLDPTGAASWSYRLVGGADLAAANPLSTQSGTGSGDVLLTFARTDASDPSDLPVALVRSGTGRIDVAAGRDVILDTLAVDPDTGLGQLAGGTFDAASYGQFGLLGASMYTAGKLSAVHAGFTAPKNDVNQAYGGSGTSSATFADNGGAISVYANRDVIGPVTNQLVNNWLFRQGRSTIASDGSAIFDTANFGTNKKLQNTTWWARYDYFDQGFATFGGGDISLVAATGNMVDVSASVATNAYIWGPAPLASNLVQNGGGDLTVRSGGDIRGGAYYVQKGVAALSAMGSMTLGDHVVEDIYVPGDGPNGGILIAMGTVLALGDAQASVTANGSLAIEGIFNPMMGAQSLVNQVAVPFNRTLPEQYGLFSTYGADSSVKLTSLAGTVTLKQNADMLLAAGGLDIQQEIPVLGSDFLSFYNVLPGTLKVAALSGDISLEHGFSLFPSTTGQLDLLAKGSVRVDFQKDESGALIGTSQPIVMIDRNVASMPTALNPRTSNDSDLAAIRDPGFTGFAYHTDGGLHSGDLQPVHIIALDGDIDFSATNTLYPTTLALAKRAEISAGRDIIDLGVSIQHLDANDVSTVTAGRDIIDSTLVGSANEAALRVAGPGRIDLSAGRNFDLGNGRGVETRGSLDNPYLPAQGAAINVAAGAKPDYANFLQRYSAVTDLPESEQAALVSFIRGLDPSLSGTLSTEDAWVAFNALSPSARVPFLNSVFFDAVARSAGAIGTNPLDLAKFDAVIASLFPLGSVSGGDVNVFGSQLKTDKGGAITIFAPGGSVYAGLVSLPAYLSSKSASELGIFTIAGGNISALVKNDFLVNQGRVFTLGGGDITLTSQYGNIDAGRGAKTAQSTPPPVLTTDAKGNTVIDISGSISGSGIATLRTGVDVPNSNVYAIAPRGIFDAGDAGVRSTGSVSLVAQTVLNANNIAASGAVSGAHATDTSALGGTVAPPPPPPTTEPSKKIANGDEAQGGSLTVELVGYGNGERNGGSSASGQQNVTQDSQTPSPAEGDAERKKKKSQ